MTALLPLHSIVGLSVRHLSREECSLLEADLYTRICEALKEYYKKEYYKYFRFMRLTAPMENTMLDTNFARFIINDILSSDEYNIIGISNYVDIHKDVVEEIAIGHNTNPSAMVLRKIIELHRTVRRDLYESIIKKVSVQYLQVSGL